MIIIKTLLTLLLPYLIGLTAIAIVSGKKNSISIWEKIGLSWGLGAGIFGLMMFAVSLTGLKITLLTAALPNAVVLAGLTGYLLFKKVLPIKLNSLSLPQKIKPAELLLALLIGLTIAYVFFDALVKPIVNFDDLWRQGSIAKIIYVTGQVVTPQTAELAGGHPYLNPLSQAWIYLGLGDWNDALGKIIFPLYFTSLIMVFYGALRRSSSRQWALLFTYLLTSFPLIVYHAGTAYTDLMQTFYYTAGIIYLYSWLKEKQNSRLWLAALLLGIGNFAKQSGIPLWVAATAVLFLYLIIEDRKNLKLGAGFVAISAAISAPWLFHENSFLMAKLLDVGAGNIAAALPAGDPSLNGIFYHLFRRSFTYADYQLLWSTVILVTFCGWRKIWGSSLKYLLLIIVLDLGMIMAAFLEPHAYQYLVDGTLVNRLMMYPAPVALFFAALAGLSLLRDDPKIGADLPAQRPAGKKRV